MMVEEKAKKIKLLILDVDGVMTDGRIIYDNFGDELKFFDVHDGMALALWKFAGLKLVIMSAKGSRIVKRRARECSADGLYMKMWDKAKGYEKIVKRFRVKDEEVAAMGDDLLDIPVLKRAGLGTAVANAAEETKQSADYVTKKLGGRGAVREVIELILKSQGKWQEVAGKYFK